MGAGAGVPDALVKRDVPLVQSSQISQNTHVNKSPMLVLETLVTFDFKILRLLDFLLDLGLLALMCNDCAVH